MSNDKNGAKYGNMGIKWTVLIRLIDIRTQKSVLTYNTWQKIWKYYECHFSYVFWWKKRVFQRRVFLIIEEAKKNIFLLYICIGMGAATVPMQIPTFGIFEHPYPVVSRLLNTQCHVQSSKSMKRPRDFWWFLIHFVRDFCISTELFSEAYFLH